MTNEQATLAVGWIGQKAVDREGHKLGRIADVYVDVGTGLPTWTVIRGGAWRRHARFVPLEGVSGQGRSLQFPLSKSQLYSAAKVSIDGRLESEEAEQLSRHYRLVALDQPAPGWDRLEQQPGESSRTSAPGQMAPAAQEPMTQANAPASWPGGGAAPDGRERPADAATARPEAAPPPPPPQTRESDIQAGAGRRDAPVDLTNSAAQHEETKR